MVAYVSSDLFGRSVTCAECSFQSCYFEEPISKDREDYLYRIMREHNLAQHPVKLYDVNSLYPAEFTGFNAAILTVNEPAPETTPEKMLTEWAMKIKDMRIKTLKRENNRLQRENDDLRTINSRKTGENGRLSTELRKVNEDFTQAVLGRESDQVRYEKQIENLTEMMNGILANGRQNPTLPACVNEATGHHHFEKLTDTMVYCVMCGHSITYKEA